jgi:hypothetical protein
MVQRIRLLVVAAVTAAALPVLAAAACDNRTFQGVYGLQVTGALYSLPGFLPQTPIARLGRATTDGAGRFHLENIGSYGGVLATEPVDGNYVVNPDCTFTLKLFSPPPVNLWVTFQGTVSEDGSYLNFMQLDPEGTTVKATGKRGYPSCTYEDLTGRYNVEMKGVIVPYTDLPADFGGVTVGHKYVPGDYAQVGLMTLEAPSEAERASGVAGRMSADTIVSYQGRVKSEKWSGTYVVNPDCTVTARYLASGGVPGDLEIEWWGVLVGGRTFRPSAANSELESHDRELRFIVSAPLLGPLTGTLIKQ